MIAKFIVKNLDLPSNMESDGWIMIANFVEITSLTTWFIVGTVHWHSYSVLFGFTNQ